MIVDSSIIKVVTIHDWLDHLQGLRAHILNINQKAF